MAGTRVIGFVEIRQNHTSCFGNRFFAIDFMYRPKSSFPRKSSPSTESSPARAVQSELHQASRVELPAHGTDDPVPVPGLASLDLRQDEFVLVSLTYPDAHRIAIQHGDIKPNPQHVGRSVCRRMSRRYGPCHYPQNWVV